MRVILIDNYDSYTYNLYQLIWEVTKEEPIVFYSDKVSVKTIKRRLEEKSPGCIIISPGPGNPSNPDDIGICGELFLQLPNVPIFGVCLGHQILAHVHGGKVVRAPEPVHGRVQAIKHSGHSLFQDIPSGKNFAVVRYHSLVVDSSSLPPCLEAICWSDGEPHVVSTREDFISLAAADVANILPDPLNSLPSLSTPSLSTPPAPSTSTSALIMGLSHKTRPHYGVQFHPESIASSFGRELMVNFLRVANDASAAQGGRGAAGGCVDDDGYGDAMLDPEKKGGEGLGGKGQGRGDEETEGEEEEKADDEEEKNEKTIDGEKKKLKVIYEKLEGALDAAGGAERIFEGLYKFKTHSFWLDSASADRGRFSFMGGVGGSLWRRFEFSLPPAAVGLKESKGEEGGRVGNSKGRLRIDRLKEERRGRNGAEEKKGAEKTRKDVNGLMNTNVQIAYGDESSLSPLLSSSVTSGSDCGFETEFITTGFFDYLEDLCRTFAIAPADVVPANPTPFSSSDTDKIQDRDKMDIELKNKMNNEKDNKKDNKADVSNHVNDTTNTFSNDVAASLPFGFWGGLVGYLGYELKAECGAKLAHDSDTPDAVMYLADRFLVLDSLRRDVYAMALYDSGHTCRQAATWDVPAETESAARSWVQGTVDEIHRMSDKLRLGLGLGLGLSKASIHLTSLSSQHHPPALTPKDRAGLSLDPDSESFFELRESESKYLANVSTCLDYLAAGESYELCLTTRMRRHCRFCEGGEDDEILDPEILYRRLRRMNPAPYSAWIHCGSILAKNDLYCSLSSSSSSSPYCENANESRRTNCRTSPSDPNPSTLVLCCSSPELFLRLDADGTLEAKPIKGTAPRVLGLDPESRKKDQAAAETLRHSEKDRAENLMIVDLLRNDLGRVCEKGSVHVPSLMNIESYATVHQMVSTVRGLRKKGEEGGGGKREEGGRQTEEVSAIQCIRSAFPGGSMTGAPKIRTMALLDDLEGGPRGVYSGSLGFIGFNSTFHLNIVIRTAVIKSDASTSAGSQSSSKEEEKNSTCHVSIGAGGAIVIQSDPQGEFEEMLLKARALKRAVASAFEDTREEQKRRKEESRII